MRRTQQQGFTYIAIIMAVAVMGLILAAVGEVWHTAQKREKEKELLFIGHQFRQAIGLYYERTPGEEKQYPKSLDELLADKRFPNSPAYLRKIFYDPMTRKKDWGLVLTPDGRVMGVHSFSQDQPLKTSNFSSRDHALEGKSMYSEWEFFYQRSNENQEPMDIKIPHP